MNIVVVDGYTLNPGDLSWQAFDALGRCTVYDRSTTAQVVERCRDAEVVLTNKVEFGEAEFTRLPRLKYLGVLATGFNVVDIEAAAQRDIVVTNTPAYGSDSVAQFVFAQLLHWAQPVAYYANTVKQQRWSGNADFCYFDHSMVELAGKTLGVVGFGAIGRRVATIASAFGMRVLVSTRTLPKDLPAGVECVDLNQLASESDMVSLHCPLTDANRGFINADFLRRMKSTAYLMNTGRGPLIDEHALFDALRSDAIAGAALDVLSIEPPEHNHPLFALDNCTITPHIAWATVEARTRLMAIAADNLGAFLAGEIKNRVS